MELRKNSPCVRVPDNYETIKAASDKVARWTIVHGNDVITMWRALIPGWFWTQSQYLQCNQSVNLLHVWLPHLSTLSSKTEMALLHPVARNLCLSGMCSMQATSELPVVVRLCSSWPVRVSHTYTTGQNEGMAHHQCTCRPLLLHHVLRSVYGSLHCPLPVLSAPDHHDNPPSS